MFELRFNPRAEVRRRAPTPGAPSIACPAERREIALAKQSRPRTSWRAGRRCEGPSAASVQAPVAETFVNEIAGEPAGVLLAERGTLFARQPSVIDRLSPDAAARIRAAGRTLRCERGDILYRQGAVQDGIAIIESGMIRSFYTAPGGRTMTLAYWSPGNFVGGPDVFGGGLHMWSAEAAQRSVLTLLPGDALRALTRDCAEATSVLLDAVIFKARCYASLAQMLGTRSLTQRLAQVLLHLIDAHGVPHRDEAPSVLIAASFTHAEIAELIGATRQWVTTSLSRLQKEGVIRRSRGMLIVERPDLLRASVARNDG